MWCSRPDELTWWSCSEVKLTSPQWEQEEEFHIRDVKYTADAFAAWKKREFYLFIYLFWGLEICPPCGEPRAWIDALSPHSLNWMAGDWFIWELWRKLHHTLSHRCVWCTHTPDLRCILTALNHVLRPGPRHLDPRAADLDNGSAALQHLTLSVSVCVGAHGHLSGLVRTVNSPPLSQEEAVCSHNEQMQPSLQSHI